ALAKIAPSLRADAYSQNLGTENYGAKQLPSPSLQATTSADDRAFNNQLHYVAEQLRNEIESAKEQLRQLEAKMDPIKDQIDSLNAQIAAYATAIDRYERDNRLGYQVDTDSYKNTIARHNSLVQEHNRLLTEYRSIIAEHKALVRETNEKVDRYNNMI